MSYQKDEIIAEVTDPDTGEDMFVRVTTSDTPVDDRKVLILAYEDGSIRAERQRSFRKPSGGSTDQTRITACALSTTARTRTRPRTKS